VAKKLAVAWRTLLTQEQRDGWRAYARQWPRVNRWGEPLNIGGYQAFFRACHYYFIAEGDLDPEHDVADGDLLVKSAPVGGPTYVPLVEFRAASNADKLIVTVPPSNYAAMDGDSYVWLFGGKPVGPGVEWFGGPWRYIGFNKWTGSWSSDPWIVDHPWPFDGGQKIHVEAVMQLADTGELSTRGRTRAVGEVIAENVAVTGELTPDATGHYTRGEDMEGGETYWRDEGVYLLWHWDANSWVIMEIIELPLPPESEYWIRNVEDPEGAYVAEGGAVGVATVTLVF